MTIWFTSDTHFGHKNIIKFEEGRKHFNSIDEQMYELRFGKSSSKIDGVYKIGDNWGQRERGLMLSDYLCDI